MGILLERLGLPLGTMHVLSVPGRKSGQMRTTPISLLTMNSQRYYGRKKERIALTELPEAERVPILRAFPKLVPGGISFFQRLYRLPSDPAALPDAFAALAPRSTVFQIGPLPDEKPHP